MYVLPWLTQNNPLQYAEAGARLGASLRGQDQQAAADARRLAFQQKEAEDRTALEQNAQSMAGANAGNQLRYSYDSLAQRQAEEQAQLAARMQQTEAANKLRQSQLDYLSEYRNQQQANQNQRIADNEAKISAAQLLKKSISDATTGFAQSVQQGADPADAYSKFPSADPNVVHPLLAESFKEKRAALKPALADKGVLDFEAPGQDAGLTPSERIRFRNIALSDPTINRVLGTNAPPGTGTNYVSAAQRLNAPAVAPVPSITTPTLVPRKYKGRTALFNPETKTFVRYADDEQPSQASEQ